MGIQVSGVRFVDLDLGGARPSEERWRESLLEETLLGGGNGSHGAVWRECTGR